MHTMFPRYGRFFSGFSTLWNSRMQNPSPASAGRMGEREVYSTTASRGERSRLGERSGNIFCQFFHAMEDFLPILPRYGRFSSTVWKTKSSAPVPDPCRLSGHWILSLVILGFLVGCAPTPRHPILAGHTMGTTYSIRIADSPLDRRALKQLHADINVVLEEINRQMSIWQPESEISSFNRTGANEPFAVTADFAQVVRSSLAYAEITGGAFDPTVGALVDLWGFGPDGLRRDAPSPAAIAAVRETVGWRHLAITDDDRLCKDIPGLLLDLGAVAKGFGVDQVAVLLRKRGLENFLVEIGGETLADGFNADGEPWRVGVLRPDDSGILHGVVPLTGGHAIATSGDYRNFYRDQTGILRSHVIDPRTATPVGHAVASVSVLAPDCLTADALATALFVLGPDEGLPLLESALPGIDALFLLRQPDGSFTEMATPEFRLLSSP